MSKPFRSTLNLPLTSADKASGLFLFDIFFAQRVLLCETIHSYSVWHRGLISGTVVACWTAGHEV